MTHDGHYFIGVVCRSANNPRFYATFTKNGIFVKQFQIDLHKNREFDGGDGDDGSDDGDDDDGVSDDGGDSLFFNLMPAIDQFNNIYVKLCSDSLITVCNFNAVCTFDVGFVNKRKDVTIKPFNRIKINTLILPTTGGFVEIYRKTTKSTGEYSMEILIYPVQIIDGCIDEYYNPHKILKSKPRTFTILGCDKFVGITTIGQFVCRSSSDGCVVVVE